MTEFCYCITLCAMFKLRIILLSAFLLLSQSGILLHELDSDHFASGHNQCEICLSANGLDGALTASSSATPDVIWLNADRLPQPIVAIPPRPIAHYQSRAPPLLKAI